MSNSANVFGKCVCLGAIVATMLACALVLTFAPRALAAESDDATGIAAGAAASDTPALATQASASASSYGLLAKNGYLYPCNAKGKKLASGWNGNSDKAPYKISTLFVAPNVKKIPERVNYVTVYSSRNKYTNKTRVGSSDNLKSVVFLLKGGKNACKSIAAEVFTYSKKLKTVKNLNKTKMSAIGERAFSNCAIKAIALPKTLKAMGEYAFQNCKSLKTISGLNKTSLKSIPKGAFYNCFSLKSISLPKSCKTVKDYAFESCGRATKLALGSKTTSLGNGAFSSCASLKSVTLPKSVKAMGSSCFSNCTDLTKFTMKSTTMVVNVENKSYSMSGVLYGTPIYNEKAGAYIYVPASTLKSYRSDDYSAPWGNYQYKNRFRAI